MGCKALALTRVNSGLRGAPILGKLGLRAGAKDAPSWNELGRDTALNEAMQNVCFVRDSFR